MQTLPEDLRGVSGGEGVRVVRPLRQVPDGEGVVVEALVGELELVTWSHYMSPGHTN